MYASLYHKPEQTRLFNACLDITLLCYYCAYDTLQQEGKETHTGALH